MPRILLAWEYGRHLGHISRLRTLAKDMDALRVETSWCVPRGMESHFRDLATHGPILQSPSMDAGGASSQGAIYSFADILLALGLGDAQALRVAVAHWQRIFDHVRPDGVVLDYAPVAQFAAQLAGLKALRISNGFDMPPPSCPTFDLGIRGPFVENHRRFSISSLSAAMEHVSRHGSRNFSFSSSLAYPTLLLDTVRELDPYDARGEGAGCFYVGPVFERGVDEAQDLWPQGGSGMKIFAYLRACHGAAEILCALSGMPFRVLCVCPDAPPELLRKFNSPAMTVTRTSVSLDVVLDDCSAVVNYGSCGMVCASLLRGKPQLVFPADIEKKLMALAVQRCQAGRMASPGGNVSQALQNLVGENRFYDNAEHLKAKYSAIDFLSLRRRKIEEWLLPFSAASAS